MSDTRMEMDDHVRTAEAEKRFRTSRSQPTGVDGAVHEQDQRHMSIKIQR